MHRKKNIAPPSVLGIGKTRMVFKKDNGNCKQPIGAGRFQEGTVLCRQVQLPPSIKYIQTGAITKEGFMAGVFS
jgi:hypothetical protein